MILPGQVTANPPVLGEDSRMESCYHVSPACQGQKKKGRSKIRPLVVLARTSSDISFLYLIQFTRNVRLSLD